MTKIWEPVNSFIYYEGICIQEQSTPQVAQERYLVGRKSDTLHTNLHVLVG